MPGSGYASRTGCAGRFCGRALVPPLMAVSCPGSSAASDRLRKRVGFGGAAGHHRLQLSNDRRVELSTRQRLSVERKTTQAWTCPAPADAGVEAARYHGLL
jgi:hypothetical protein